LENISIGKEGHYVASLNLRLKVFFRWKMTLRFKVFLLFLGGKIEPEIEAFLVVHVENHQTSGGEFEFRHSFPHGVKKVRLNAWFAGQLPRINIA
jgi:hypothetical protein